MDAERARRALTEERSRLAELNERTRERAPEGGGTQQSGVEFHPGDHGTDVEEQLERSGLEGDTARGVSEIDAALARLDEGTWGRCAVCGREIDAERLEARPQTDRCRDHAE